MLIGDLPSLAAAIDVVDGTQTFDGIRTSAGVGVERTLADELVRPRDYGAIVPLIGKATGTSG
jgi:hypothetical protein